MSVPSSHRACHVTNRACQLCYLTLWIVTCGIVSVLVLVLWGGVQVSPNVFLVSLCLSSSLLARSSARTTPRKQQGVPLTLFSTCLLGAVSVSYPLRSLSPLPN